MELMEVMRVMEVNHHRSTRSGGGEEPNTEVLGGAIHLHHFHQLHHLHHPFT